MAVDVVVVTRGNYELVLSAAAQPSWSRELGLIEALRPEVIERYRLPNYTAVARSLYSRRLQGEQPDNWRHFRAGLLDAVDVYGAPQDAIAGVRLGAVMVANALNNGWLDEKAIDVLGLHTRSEMQAWILLRALDAIDLPRSSLWEYRPVMETARLVLERGPVFAATLMEHLK